MNENIYAFFSFIWMKKVILELNTNLKSRLFYSNTIIEPICDYAWWALMHHFMYRKTPNKRPLGENIQYDVVEGISTFQVLFTE